MDNADSGNLTDILRATLLATEATQKMVAETLRQIDEQAARLREIDANHDLAVAAMRGLEGRIIGLESRLEAHQGADDVWRERIEEHVSAADRRADQSYSTLMVHAAESTNARAVSTRAIEKIEAEQARLIETHLEEQAAKEVIKVAAGGAGRALIVVYNVIKAGLVLALAALKKGSAEMKKNIYLFSICALIFVVGAILLMASVGLAQEADDAQLITGGITALLSAKWWAAIVAGVMLTTRAIDMAATKIKKPLPRMLLPWIAMALAMIAEGAQVMSNGSRWQEAIMRGLATGGAATFFWSAIAKKFLLSSGEKATRATVAQTKKGESEHGENDKTGPYASKQD